MAPSLSSSLNLPVLLLTFIGVALVLFLYVLNVSRAAIIHEPDNGVLRVQGFRERIIDLNKVAGLQTITVKSGMRAESMAKELAAELGLDFQANVPEWEYDKEAQKAHDIEVERQQKDDARKRREGKAKLRQAKLRERAEHARDENKK